MDNGNIETAKEIAVPQNLESMKKYEVYEHIINEVQKKIRGFEIDMENQASSMTSANLPYYLNGQNALIGKWRSFLTFLEKNRNHESDKVEVGSLVKVLKEERPSWVIIYPLQAKFLFLETVVEIDDGSFGRFDGNIQGACEGDSVRLTGDERGISDLEVKILKVI